MPPPTTESNKGENMPSIYRITAYLEHTQDIALLHEGEDPMGQPSTSPTEMSAKQQPTDRSGLPEAKSTTLSDAAHGMHADRKRKKGRNVCQKKEARKYRRITKRFEDLEKKLLACGKTTNKNKFVPAAAVTVPAPPVSVKLSTYDRKTTGRLQDSILYNFRSQWMDGRGQSFSLSAFLREILQGLRTPANQDKTPENWRKLAGICLRSRKARQLGLLRPPSHCERSNLFAVFRGGPEGGGNQKSVRMAHVQDLKSPLLCALKLKAANEASCRDRHTVKGARATADAPCESR
ncbi:hypothetical protein TNCV_1684181 [Trichonephila clavipes]|nr:hypothetical protein TNCV_1684181 [Trichonephila clavipes]